MRSNNEVAAAAAREGNALRRARGFLSASGVTRSMISGVIVAGVFSSTLRYGLYFTGSPITYDYLRVVLYDKTLLCCCRRPQESKVYCK